MAGIVSFAKSPLKAKVHNTAVPVFKVALRLACKKPFLKQSSQKNAFTDFYFCTTTKRAETAISCSKCNIRIISKECGKAHKKNVCRFGWMCPLCEKYTYRTKYFSTVEDIINNHVCGQRMCKFCGNRLERSHQCPFQIPKIPNNLSKLAFLTCN